MTTDGAGRDGIPPDGITRDGITHAGITAPPGEASATHDIPSLAPTRARRVLLAVIVLFLGGSGLVYEYCISTLATHLLGNSVEQFSLIIALMLFAMGLAGLFQRALRDPERIAEWFVLCETLLGLIGGASAVLLYLAFAWLDHFRLALYTLSLLIGFGIGLEIPLLLRINQIWRRDLRDNVGDVLALDYIGALAGALVWAFLLLPLFALDRISLFLGLANMAAAAVTLAAFWRYVRRKLLVVGVLLASFAALLALTLAAPDLIVEARQRLYRDPIRHHAESPYQDIVVTGRGARMSLYLNGHLQFDSEDEHIYHELLVHPALAATIDPPRDVLVLGGGDGLAVREVLRWPTVRRVLLVDLDPAVTALARSYPPLVALNAGALTDARVEARPAAGVSPGRATIVNKAAEHPRDAIAGHEAPIAEVRLMHLDADEYLSAIDSDWDAIIADFPDPSTPDLAKLFSLELYQVLRTRLRPGGVLAVQAGSPYNTRAAYWAVRDTLQAAGFTVRSLHAHVPTFGEWGWHIAAPDRLPLFTRALPAGLRYLDAAVLRAAETFPAPIARPDGPPRVSTRLDPWVMRLYQRGEPLEGMSFFPGDGRR
ncbi:MAG: polyamine aminopropyltransferase [Myxococcales bacterium]|nr:polyamine aminopropyltransferase [Myxococcales bacterium]